MPKAKGKTREKHAGNERKFIMMVAKGGLGGGRVEVWLRRRDRRMGSGGEDSKKAPILLYTRMAIYI